MNVRKKKGSTNLRLGEERGNIFFFFHDSVADGQGLHNLNIRFKNTFH